MTAFRLISLPLHGAAELMLGLVVMVAPFVLGFSVAGTIAGVTIGAIAVGLGLAAATADLGGIDVTAHTAYDLGIVLGFLGAAVVMAAASDAAAALVLAAAGAVQLALHSTTRYSAR